MEEALSTLSLMSPQGIEAQGSKDGEPGHGGARVEGREAGSPEVPTNGSLL